MATITAMRVALEGNTKYSFNSLTYHCKLIWTCYIPSTVINLKISTARAVAEEGPGGVKVKTCSRLYWSIV